MSESSKAGGADQVRAIEWREDSMSTQFANVVNVQGTREQVDLFFGTNRTWNLAETESVVVDLSNRVILTPLAAKRLHSVLGGVLTEYENRHGRLDLDGLLVGAVSFGRGRRARNAGRRRRRRVEGEAGGNPRCQRHPLPPIG